MNQPARADHAPPFPRSLAPPRRRCFDPAARRLQARRDDVTLTLTAPTVTKTGGDASSPTTSAEFGLNAGVLAAGSSHVAIVGGTVTTNAVGASALFATGAGSVVTMSGGTLTTLGTAS